jgi:hypothetical protein
MPTNIDLTQYQFDWADLPYYAVNKHFTHAHEVLRLAWYHSNFVFMKDTRFNTKDKPSPEIRKLVDSLINGNFEDMYGVHSGVGRERFNSVLVSIYEFEDIPTRVKKARATIAPDAFGSQKIKEVVYDPLTSQNCFKMCIVWFCEHILQNTKYKNVLPLLKIPAHVTKDYILAICEFLKINVIIIDEKFDCDIMQCIDQAPILTLQLETTVGGQGHVKVVEADVLVTPQSENDIVNLNETDELNDKIASGKRFISELEKITLPAEHPLERLTWSIYGNLSNHFVKSPCVIPCYSKLTNLPNVMYTPNLEPDNVYIYLFDTAYYLLTIKHLDTTYSVTNLNEKIFYAVKMKYNWQKVGAEVLRKTRIIKQPDFDEIGFISIEEKQKSTAKYRGGWESYPVNRDARKLLITEFTNRDHHNLPERTLVLQKEREDVLIAHDKTSIENGLVDETYTIDEEIWQALKYGGPLRLTLNSEGWAIASVTQLVDLSFISTKLGEQDYEVQMAALKSFDNKWVNKGNNLSPLPINDSVKHQQLKLRCAIVDYNKKLLYINTPTLTAREINMAIPDAVDDTNPEAEYEVICRVIDNSVFLPIWKDFKWQDEFYDSSTFTRISFSRVGSGYAEYIGKTVESVVVDANILNTVNTIDDLVKQKTVSKRDEDVLYPGTTELIKSIESLNNFQNVEPDIPFNYENKLETASQTNELVGFDTSGDITTKDLLMKVAAPHVMNFHDDETALVPGIINLSNKNMNFSLKDEFGGLTDVTKTYMTKYPTHAQPNYIKRYLADATAALDLFGNKLTLRQVEHDPYQDAKDFAEVYFKKGAVAALPAVSLNAESIKNWLLERPDSVNISKELHDIFSDGLEFSGMDQVKIHNKLESRMKDVSKELTNLLTLDSDIKMPETIDEQRVRQIVWQRKGITCIFASFFKDIKENLKRCLIDKVHYVDGWTPQQISAHLNKITIIDNDVQFAEDDLAKQDRQTDHTCIKTEMEIYKILGGNSHVVDMWHTVHFNWRAKGAYIRFVGDASRHTGQATTSLGNAIINLLVKKRLVKLHLPSIYVMYVLGDDNIIVCKSNTLTKESIETQSARHFNMQSKAVLNKLQGSFLRMLIYVNMNNTLECSPDFVRLCRRFEVLNGVSDVNSNNIEMRAMSYSCMLGALDDNLDLIKQKQWPIRPGKWYNYHTAVQACANMYKCSIDEVESDVNHLINYMRKLETFDNVKKHFVYAKRGKQNS